MKEILVKDIIRECNASLIMGDENLKIENFSKDTREINENDCYIGIKGETFDGNLFYKGLRIFILCITVDKTCAFLYFPVYYSNFEIISLIILSSCLFSFLSFSILSHECITVE